ncbi:hypothetical protein HGA88_05710 [Candidatus Roizmanbacteria bacterium]|nr:hypothetical protein [Candidatus Roizmanbacteria bacterium]
MKIDLNKLHHTFKHKPLLVGGKAMEYYGLRKAGPDIDFIADENDVQELIKIYPKRVKSLWGDLGVCPEEFEIWKTICLFDYEYYKKDAIEEENFLVISLEKLLLMRALAMKKEKYLKDLSLIVNHVLHEQGVKYQELNNKNETFLKDIKDIVYLEKTEPSSELL